MVVAAELSRGEPRTQWLVDGLWSQGGVGLLGGPPKSCKSWLGLDLALSVASATPCLGHFQVKQAGPVLVYMAEDAGHIVHERLLGLCRHRKLSLKNIPLFFISEPRIHLDRATDRRRLSETVERLAPSLLVLDPLVRVHGCDENDAGAVSSMLAHLRELQRRFELSILLVHHTRKSGAAAAQIGLSLRGSGDFHAWGDHNLYLRRVRGQLELRLEHRAAATPTEPFYLELDGEQGAVHLALLRSTGGPPAQPRHEHASQQPPEQRVLTALGMQSEPVSLRKLRHQTKMRTQTLCQVLAELSNAGQVIKNGTGYRLGETSQTALPIPVSTDP